MLNSNTSKDASTAELLGQLTGDYLDRAARGENPQVEEYAQRYPEIAKLIRDVFPLLDLIKLSASESNSTAFHDSTAFAKNRQLEIFVSSVNWAEVAWGWSTRLNSCRCRGKLL